MQLQRKFPAFDADGKDIYLTNLDGLAERMAVFVARMRLAKELHFTLRTVLAALLLASRSVYCRVVTLHQERPRGRARSSVQLPQGSS